MGLCCLCSYIVSFTALIASGIIIVFGYIIRTYRKKRFTNSQEVAFFHPYCNDGGGGEKVLWVAVQSILKIKNTNVTIYTGDDCKPSDILARVQQRFNITIPPNVSFIYLKRRKWIEASMYPYFTILGQSVGSIWLGLEALNAHQPDIFIDTMGYAFTYPLFKYFGYCTVATYTHYPTITSEMIKKVSTRTAAHNNDTRIANSRVLTFGKLFYYSLFAHLYGMAGRCADIVMVNSSWTKNHIDHLWGVESNLVYPPCDVEEFKEFKRNIKKLSEGEIRIVSVAQFRPEKNHKLQLEALAKLRDLVDDNVWKRIKLVVIGAARHKDDHKIVTNLNGVTKELNLENNVDFKINIPYEDLKKELSEATIGIHSMWNEHFGIGVVDCLAAGLITIAHDSGGPKMDIIKRGTGFLAETAEQYAEAIADIINMSADELNTLIENARLHVDRFSVPQFEKQFQKCMNSWLNVEED